MRVEATKLGYFNHQVREPGDQFDIPDEPKGKDGKPKAFSKNWMAEVEAAAPKQPDSGKKARKGE